MGDYKAVIVGLTGIGATRPGESKDPVYAAMPNSHASAYFRHPKTRVVGVCDLKPELLRDFKARWEDVWPGVRTYTDYREMFEKEKPDIISVVTPDHLHAEVTVAATESGAKAILCEKPIATTLEDADRMTEAAEKRGVLLSIEHTRRWHPGYLKARQVIRSGEIGALRTVVGEMLGARAMMFRNGTHMIDMICFFAGGNPAWVVGELEPGFDHFTAYEGDGGHAPSSEPYTSALLAFDNGVRAFVNFYKTKFPGSKFSLTCDDGRIEISDQKAELITAQPPRWWSHSAMPEEAFMFARQSGAVAELVEVMENGGELVSPPREARKTLEILLGILRSHHAGQVRVDFPLKGSQGDGVEL